MLAQRLFGWLRGAQAEPTQEQEPCEVIDLRTGERTLVYKSATLALEDHYKIPATVTELSSTGALVRYTVRIDLPSRLVIIVPAMRLKTWARLVWQDFGEAGLELLPNEDAPN
jgi:hypothetical protein